MDKTPKQFIATRDLTGIDSSDRIEATICDYIIQGDECGTQQDCKARTKAIKSRGSP